MSAFRRTASATSSPASPTLPAGVKLAPFSGQPVVSSGIASLDEVLGGGIPIGTVVGIVQDEYTAYHRVMLRYFVAQGVSHGKDQRTALLTAEDPDLIWTFLPSWQRISKDIPEEPAVTLTDKMKIAWRYEKLPSLSSANQASSTPALTGGTSYMADFNLATPATADAVSAADCVTIDLNSHAAPHSDNMFESAYLECERIISEEFDSWKERKPGQKRRILRLAIDSFGSAAWCPSRTPDMIKFLVKLRALLRHAFAVCVFTFPAHLYSPASHAMVLRHVDTAIELVSFTDFESSTKMGGYHGLFKLHRVSHEAVLLPPSLKLGWVGQDMGFKLFGRRRGFVIERLALPPEGGVSERRISPNDAKHGLSKENLDF